MSGATIPMYLFQGNTTHPPAPVLHVSSRICLYEKTCATRATVGRLP